MRVFVYLASVLVLLSWGNLRADDQYLTQVKPVLKARCYACHGGLKQESDLRLDTAAAIQASGIIQSGDLIDRITSSDLELRMPPEGEALKPQEIELIRQWIAKGAKGPADEQAETNPSQHWAFLPVARPPVPRSDFTHPIDAFLDVERKARGLAPLEAADRNTLIRRIYIDLIGMPPDSSELKRLATEDMFSYERLVDRLLEDPRHGERWGRHWMDVWRYSDWWGLGSQLRNSQKHIWHWRDWIVESLNEDAGYDEMIRQMLAADELYPNDLDKLRAGGYLARNWFLFNRNQWMDETVEHVSKGFLGLTFNCAKCHDHKYDPLEQHDYYSMRAFFEPYHVRMDMVPGETNLAVDGIPRPFDADLEMPTYIFERGNDKHPDTSQAMTPDVPAVFKLPLPPIEPVELPADAWQPGLRQAVIQAHLARAQADIDVKVSAVAAAESKLAEAQKRFDEYKNSPAPGKTTEDRGEFTFEDAFKSLDREVWEVFGGKWEVREDGLYQLTDGPQRAVIRLKQKIPKDFEATLRFVTTGGSKWRSLGIEFDAVSKDPSKELMKGDNAQNIYVSGYLKGPKIQGAYNVGGGFQYPTDGAQKIEFEVNREYAFTIKVRDNLVNAFLDGQLVVAWRSPVERREGAIQLTCFDLLPVLKSFVIRALPESEKLTEASARPQETIKAPGDPRLALQDAKSALAVAQMDVEIAKQHARHLEVSRNWFVASRDQGDAADDQLRIAAVRSERALAVTRAKREVALAEAAVAKADGKKEESTKNLEAKTKALAEANSKMDAEIGEDQQIALLVGAAWTPTRFASSSRDDKFRPFLPTSSGRRTALARWISDAKNPLTARVAVNHVWTRHMGKPLVASVFDFGRNGDTPKHQALLDWLAVEFMENDWSFKHLHRLITTSAAYQMKSYSAEAAAQNEKDSENHYWWRRETIRLESQAVRDSILRLAGQLDLTMGGKPIPAAQQSSSKRRSLYFYHSNNSRNLFLTMFDEALVTDCYRREQSIVPQQALALANSGLVLDNCSAIAAEIVSADMQQHDFISAAFVYLLGRLPDAQEIQSCTVALEKWLALPGSREGVARENLVWVLLNHNDFLTVR